MARTIYGMNIEDLPKKKPEPDTVCLCVVDRFGEIAEILEEHSNADEALANMLKAFSSASDRWLDGQQHSGLDWDEFIAAFIREYRGAK